MRYPEHLSDIGYYKKLLEQYSKEYPEFPKKSVIAGSITIVLNAISDLIEKNPQKEKPEDFNKVIDYISNVGKLTEDEYNIAFKEIKPDQSVAVLYLSINNPKIVARVIQNNMKFAIETNNIERYFDFLAKVVKQSCHELAEVNKPKLTVKTVTFSVDSATPRKYKELKPDATIKTSVELVEKENLSEVNEIESNKRPIKSSTNKLK